MKTKSTLQQIALLLILLLSVTACKKDKNEPQPTPPAEVKAITITELKALSTAASVKVPDLRKIKGIVISDASGKNIDSKTVILQEATGKPGLIVMLDVANTFAAGDELEVTVSNQTLAQVNGEVVLQNVPIANVKKTGTGTVTPAETTISAILAAKATFDGTLVKIAATELSGGDGKFIGNLNVKDASGSLTSTVLPAATFSETEYPASVTSITGIVRVNGDQTRIDIRKPGDVVIGNITKVITENFENLIAIVPGFSQTPEEDISTTGFKTKAGIVWHDQSGYGAVSPFKDLSGNESFTTPGRTYIYLRGNGSGAYDFNWNNGALGLQSPVSKGLKSVKITFAISKASQAPLWFGTFPMDALSAPGDYMQIMVSPKIGSQIPGVDANGFDGPGLAELGEMSPKYTENGKFVTYTWTVPTKAQLMSKGATEADADAFIERPAFSIFNTTKTSGGHEMTLIVFDNIVFNYGN
jgi:hypothetical protein